MLYLIRPGNLGYDLDMVEPDAWPGNIWNWGANVEAALKVWEFTITKINQVQTLTIDVLQPHLQLPRKLHP